MKEQFIGLALNSDQAGYSFLFSTINKFSEDYVLLIGVIKFFHFLL